MISYLGGYFGLGFGGWDFISASVAGRAIVAGDSIDLIPDTTLVIQAQAARQVVNTGEEDLVFLVIRSLVRPPGKTMEEVMSNFRG